MFPHSWHGAFKLLHDVPSKETAAVAKTNGWSITEVRRSLRSSSADASVGKSGGGRLPGL
jgi:hypothetical protein